jgi:lipoprotein-anchoring transpeptidase ErfK/SrfK
MRRWAVVALATVVVLVLAMVGTTFAAVRYDHAHADRILPGVHVAGVDVGGMTRSQATQAVDGAVKVRLQRPLDVTAKGHVWHETPASLGMRADVAGAVDRALALSDSYSWLSRVYHRVFSRSVDRSFDVTYRMDPRPVATLVAKVDDTVSFAAASAGYSLANGRLVMTHSKTGLALKTGKATTAIQRAVDQGKASVKLPVVTTQPKVSDDQVGKAIVVNLSTNTLSLYDAFKVERTYPVATAMQGFTTPPGTWEVVNKVENPTWHNPAPDGWGAGEPLVIPPGPTNPLGTRALYLNAPGIRIHGTPEDSSIGHYASHGCIRMHIPDSEALYPLVPVGTPVFVVGAPPWGFATNPGPAG